MHNSKTGTNTNREYPYMLIASTIDIALLKHFISRPNNIGIIIAIPNIAIIANGTLEISNL
jgi:hypothetical protein